MNFEEDPDYVAALQAQFRTEIIDDRLYVAVEDIDTFIDKIALIVIQNSDGMCQHAMQMAQWIIGQIAGVTDTSIALNAEAMVPDVIPDDFDPDA